MEWFSFSLFQMRRCLRASMCLECAYMTRSSELGLSNIFVVLRIVVHCDNIYHHVK